MLTIYQVAEKIDELVHDNNLMMAITITDGDRCLTHVCEGLNDEAIRELGNHILNELKRRENKNKESKTFFESLFSNLFG